MSHDLDREQQFVELVSADGVPIGSATVSAAHAPPGLLHRAFSVLLVDADGRMLLQRRAAGKSRFPLRWANACCGHPAPGESVSIAAARRLTEELGVRGVELVDVGVFSYHAADPVTGFVEREYDHVLVGLTSAELAVKPDPAEVAETRWMRFPRRATPQMTALAGADYAPWLKGVIAVARSSTVLDTD